MQDYNYHYKLQKFDLLKLHFEKISDVAYALSQNTNNPLLECISPPIPVSLDFPLQPLYVPYH
ncbi:hypothetical protein ALC53_01838 [Atta colombica]|uniref:Uncharacterized protein n=1 Tax=Atta colombica TaxID=520822 RepID=A0A151I6E7_9HYME|nr:hypothetical protein ALC53_01838 [Atta colombica]